MRQIITTFIILIACTELHAQVRFYHAVKIEFEKTVYVKQLIRDLEPEWYEEAKSNLPEATVSYSDFIGDTVQSIYKPGKEVVQDRRFFFQPPGGNNIVYNNYRTGTTIGQKPVFEETFLVQDSLLHIKWKLTADTRTIAGFECRKAIGLVDDSVTVFAFYTDEILINGGPEGSNGLPGMILGLGVPRIHTTWFATKVEVNNIDLSKIKPETKGKKVNRQTMLQSMDKVLKNWGRYGKNMVLNFVI